MYIIVSIIFLLLLITTYYCIKFALIIIKVQETIEESLDILDKSYNKFNKILDIPIFYNSPEVKSVIAEIEYSRDSLLYIANQLVGKNEIEKEEDFE